MNNETEEVNVQEEERKQNKKCFKVVGTNSSTKDDLEDLPPKSKSTQSLCSKLRRSRKLGNISVKNSKSVLMKHKLGTKRCKKFKAVKNQRLTCRNKKKTQSSTAQTIVNNAEEEESIITLSNEYDEDETCQKECADYVCEKNISHVQQPSTPICNKLNSSELHHKKRKGSPFPKDLILKKKCIYTINQLDQDQREESKTKILPSEPTNLQPWIKTFLSWSHSDRVQAIDSLISHATSSQVRHMMKTIEPLFQRDFIALLPREIALTLLSYLSAKDLRVAAQTCRYWRMMCDDNLLWKEQCRRVGITSLSNNRYATCSSPYKTAYLHQYKIENRWMTIPVDKPIIMKGHDDHVITCLQFFGNRILSGSDDTTLKIWSATTGRCIRTLIGHTGGVWSSQMVGRLVVSGSTDRTLKIWDSTTGRCLQTLSGHTSTVRCMHMHGNIVISGSRDATLRVWSLENGRCLRVLVGHLAAVRCVQYDGKYVVSGAYDYFVKVWNPLSGECIHTLSGHTNRVYSLQFDGTHIVSGSLDTSIRVWEVESGQLKHTLVGHQSLTSGMELDNNILVSGNADSTVKVWDITSGLCIHTLSGANKHQSAVTCLQATKRFVITSSDDGTVKLWDLRTGEFIRNLVELGSGGSGGVIWRIKASQSKLICAVGSRNGTEETKLLVLDFEIPEICFKCQH